MNGGYGNDANPANVLGEIQKLRSRLAQLGKVTERMRRSLGPVHRDEEIWQTIAEQLGVAFWCAASATTEILFVSRSFQSLFGQSVDAIQMSPWSFLRAVHPADREKVIGAIRRQLLFGKSEVSFRVIHCDGEVHELRAKSASLCDAQGRFTHHLGMIEECAAPEPEPTTRRPAQASSEHTPHGRQDACHQSGARAMNAPHASWCAVLP